MVSYMFGVDKWTYQWLRLSSYKTLSTWYIYATKHVIVATFSLSLFLFFSLCLLAYIVLHMYANDCASFLRIERTRCPSVIVIPLSIYNGFAFAIP